MREYLFCSTCGFGVHEEADVYVRHPMWIGGEGSACPMCGSTASYGTGEVRADLVVGCEDCDEWCRRQGVHR